MNNSLIEQISKWDSDWSERFPKRITKKQKLDFLEAIESELHERQFETERDSGAQSAAKQSIGNKMRRAKIHFFCAF